MKPKPRTPKQRGRDERFLAEVRSILADPLRQPLANRLRAGELAMLIDFLGGLRLEMVIDGHPQEGFCERCGCTHADPCEGGCAWARQPTANRGGLCTACLTNDEIAERMGMVPCKKPRQRNRQSPIANPK